MSLLRQIVEGRTSMEELFSEANEAKYFSRGLWTTATGLAVSPETALSTTAVLACIRVLSETVASLPLVIYRRLPEGGKERALDHYLYPILHDQANPEMTSFEFRELSMSHVASWGNAYAEIELDGSGRVLGLWPLRPDRMRVYRVRLEGRSELVYVYRLPDGLGAQSKTLREYQVLHIRGLSPDGIVGYSPIQLARQAVGLSLAMEEYGARFFGNGANAEFVLQHPSQLSDDALRHLRESWEEDHLGLEKAHRMAILEEGMKIEKIGIPPDDAQFIQSRKFQINEIARMYRIPPHMIGDLEHATFCLPADVEVLTESGPKSVAEIVPGEHVWSLGDQGMTLAVVRAVVCSGEDEILDIRTTNRSLRCNPTHRLLARRKRAAPRAGVGGYQAIEWVTEYIPAGQLRAGDTIVEMDGLPEAGTDVAPNGRSLTVGFMEFCGLLLGDGNVYAGQGVSIARGAGARYMDAYRQIMRQEFTAFDGGNGRGDQGSVPRRPVNLVEGERQTRFASTLAASELLSLGFGGNARTKRVPGWVFGLAAHLRTAFVRGFLDADGSVDKKGRASFASVNLEMLSQIRHLCMGLGIPVTNLGCRRSTVRLPNGESYWSELYTFTCSDPRSNARIGSHDPVDRRRIGSGTAFGIKGRHYPRHGGRRFDTPGCGLARITSIRSLPKEAVYDLQVEATGNFVANGVIVHNSNIEHEAIGFVVHCIRPYLVRWEQRLRRSLFAPEEAKTYFPEFLVDGLLRGDVATRFAAYATARQNGWMNANEIRELENQNPIEDGDVYLVPLNMIPMGSPVPATTEQARGSLPPGTSLVPLKDYARLIGLRPPGGPQDPGNGRSQASEKKRAARERLAIAKSYRRIFQDAGERAVKRELREIKQAAAKYLDKRAQVADFEEWLRTYYRDFPEVLGELWSPAFFALSEAIQALAAREVEAPVGMTPGLDECLRYHIDRSVARHVGLSQTLVLQALRKSEGVADAVLEALEDWPERRPASFTAWETIRTSNLMAKATWFYAGAEGLEWIRLDENPFCPSLDGRVIEMSDNCRGTHFVLEGEEVPGRSDALKPAWNVSTPPLFEGCECQIAPVMPDQPVGRAGRGEGMRDAMDHSDAIARALAMQAEALRSLGQIVETLRVRGPEIRFDVDHMTQTHAPEIHVAGPDVQPLAEAIERGLGEVGQALGKLEQPAPVIEVKPEIRVTPAEARTPRLVSREEEQTVVRDRDQKITGTKTHVEYQYGEKPGE